jgi:hypothetical protein
MQELRDSGIPIDRDGNVLEDDQVNPEDGLPAGLNVPDFDIDDITAEPTAS